MLTIHGAKANKGDMTPMSLKIRVKKNAAKSPAVGARPCHQDAETNPDSRQEEELHAPDII